MSRLISPTLSKCNVKEIRPIWHQNALAVKEENLIQYWKLSHNSTDTIYFYILKSRELQSSKLLFCWQYDGGEYSEMTSSTNTMFAWKIEQIMNRDDV